MDRTAGRLSRIRSFLLERAFYRSSHHRIIGNTIWLLLDKVAFGAVGILVSAWMARYLGPESFGFYSYALAFVYLLGPFARLGLQSIVVRDIVREQQAKNEILGTALLLRLVVSISVLMALELGLLCGIGVQDKVLRCLIAIVAGQFLFSAFGEIFEYWFESQLQCKYVVWARGVSVILTSLLNVALILVSAPLIAFGVATVVQVFIFTCGTVYFYGVTGNQLAALRGSMKRARQLLADSWPVMFSGLAIVIYMKVDQIMLGNLATKESLGNYSAAVRLSEAWYFIPIAVAQSVFPSMVRSREHLSKDAFGKRMQAFFDLMVLVAYAVAVPLTLLAPLLVTTLFGGKYTEATPILRVHIWAFVSVALGAARSRWLTAENLLRFQLFSTVLGAVVNVVLNFLLIPRYAGLGAAWATLISYAVATYFSCLFYAPLWPVFRQLTLALLVPLRLLLARTRYGADARPSS